jgi:energy-coupling factor transporter ATP-binding protein EcfA2
MATQSDSPDADEVRQPARIVAVEAQGLVGRSRPVVIELADDHPVLLTGSSGSGKSTLLRGIHAVATGNFPLLASLPMSKLLLKRNGADPIVAERHGHDVSLTIGSKVWKYQQGEAVPRDEEDERYLHPSLPRLLRMEGAVTPRTAYEALRNYVGEQVRPRAPWLLDALTDLSVPYVSDDRLFALADQDVPSPVRAAPPRSRGYRSNLNFPVNSFRSVDLVDFELKAICRERTLKASREVSRIDRDLPTRVMTAVRREAEESALSSILDQISDMEVRLETFGLSGGAAEFSAPRPAPTSAEPVDGRELSVLHAVLDSYREKLHASRPLLEDLERFIDAVNRRFRGKSLTFDIRRGLRVVPQGDSRADPWSQDDESQPEVPLGMLSSGEQHLVVLLYRLIFGSAKGSLFLVDEPELSLHVAWQRELAADLAEIATHTESRYLIATHSPSVIAGHLDWEVNFDDLSDHE